MIRRLVEASYFANRDRSTPELVAFWLGELRTPELLIELVGQAPESAQARVREEDRVYWAPLRAELERLRRAR